MSGSRGARCRVHGPLLTLSRVMFWVAWWVGLAASASKGVGLAVPSPRVVQAAGFKRGFRSCQDDL